MATSCTTFETWCGDVERFDWTQAIATVEPRTLVATLLTMHLIVVALIAIPELGGVAVSTATTLGHIAWSQLSTPTPPTPAGAITIGLIRIWLNHVVDVEVPRLKGFATSLCGYCEELALARSEAFSSFARYGSTSGANAGCLESFAK